MKEVVCLPIAHCELNPNEITWSQLKNCNFTLYGFVVVYSLFGGGGGGGGGGRGEAIPFLKVKKVVVTTLALYIWHSSLHELDIWL